jgi:hypothetical protein
MEIKPQCIICGKELDMSKDNYGWHYGPNREIERCAFSVLPMMITTKPIKLKEPKSTRVIIVR